jgi:hypothetical protein
MALAEWVETTTDISATLGRFVRRYINISHVTNPQIHAGHVAERNHQLDEKSLNFLHEKMMTKQYQTSFIRRMKALKGEVSAVVID